QRDRPLGVGLLVDVSRIRVPLNREIYVAGFGIDQQLEEVPLRVVENSRQGSHPTTSPVVPEAAAHGSDLKEGVADGPEANPSVIRRVHHDAGLPGQTE